MTKFFIPNMLEFIYDALVSKPKDFIFDRLSRDELKKINTSAKAKSFAEKANIEDKQILMAKLNYGCATIFWDKDKVKTNNVHDVLISYLELDPKDLNKTIIRDKIFAIMPRDFIRALQVISKASNSNTWSVNKKYLDISHTREFLKTRKLVHKFEAESNLKWLVGFMDATLSLEGVLEGYKINIDQFRILLYLQNAPNGATKNNIKNKIGKQVAKLIADMYQMNMVEYDPKNDDVILIDTMGSLLIDQILSKI